MAAATAGGAARRAAAAGRRPLLLALLLAARLLSAAAPAAAVDVYMRNTCWNAINVSVYFSDDARGGAWSASTGYIESPNSRFFGATRGDYVFVYAETYDQRFNLKWAGNENCWNAWGKLVCGKKVYLGNLIIRNGFTHTFKCTYNRAMSPRLL
ncbi:MAG: hypothetical protein J3K34DRAFT_497226 [Monoraphidium minutum]|nr:MAG: hypothetical protein J3K34DRAFT_497226 [Monoraphidium minutum]